MEDPFSNDDVTMEVLSRLPAKDLYAIKCVSKKWNSLISNPSFLRMHYYSQRSNEIPGLFIQWDYFPNGSYDTAVTYICPCNCEDYPKMLDTLLEFLPERVIPMASCNGLLCCRSYEEHLPVTVSLIRKPKPPPKVIYIYVCNPTTKEWIRISMPTGSHVVDRIGLAFYPFGSSSNSNTTAPSFKLVSIQRSNNDLNTYSFVVYSSETGRWTTSTEVCHCNYGIIYTQREIFVGQRFHWLTKEDHIITFDVERELSGVIKLPGPIMRKENYKTCLGGSEGYLHYVCMHITEFKVWMLKDYFKQEWVLKYHLTMVDLCEEHSAILSGYTSELLNGKSYRSCIKFEPKFKPLAFYEDVLFMTLERWLFSYNFKTRSLEKHCSMPLLMPPPVLL